MQTLKTLLLLFAVSLLLAPVCVANKGTLARVKTLLAEVPAGLKRAAWRSSVADKVMTGAVTMLLLTANAYGDGAAGDSGTPLVSEAASEEAASKPKKKRYDFLSLYFGRGWNYMAESTGSFTTDIDGVEYERLGDYYGVPTTIEEKISSYVGGLGAHLETTGVEVKFFFFGGVDRVKSGVFYPDPNDGKIIRSAGNMPNIIFAGTRHLFGINARGGLAGLGENSLLTVHLGPSINIHPVIGKITSYRPALKEVYTGKDETGNTKIWEEEKEPATLVDLPAGVGGHIGFGLLWQVNLDLGRLDIAHVENSDGIEVVGVGWGVSYVGSVTHKGVHTHLLMLRLFGDWLP